MNELKIFYLFILIRLRGKGGEREGEKHQCAVASFMPPYWGPGLQPKPVSWLGRPFGSQTGAQSTDPCQPGLNFNVSSFSHTYDCNILFLLCWGLNKFPSSCRCVSVCAHAYVEVIAESLGKNHREPSCN